MMMVFVVNFLVLTVLNKRSDMQCQNDDDATCDVDDVDDEDVVVVYEDDDVEPGKDVLLELES